jgi:hypothetical protein
MHHPRGNLPRAMRLLSANCVRVVLFVGHPPSELTRLMESITHALQAGTYVFQRSATSEGYIETALIHKSQIGVEFNTHATRVHIYVMQESSTAGHQSLGMREWRISGLFFQSGPTPGRGSVQMTHGNRNTVLMCTPPPPASEGVPLSSSFGPCLIFSDLCTSFAASVWRYVLYKQYTYVSHAMPEVLETIDCINTATRYSIS